MLRAALGVILGYIVMAVTVFVTFTIAYLAMGADRAFQPGSHKVSALWLAAAIPLSIIAAIVGGYLCGIIAKRKGAVLALAGITLILGFAMAIPAMLDDRPDEPRTAEVGNMDAMRKAKQPLWIALLNPVIGAAGVLVGGSLATGRPGSNR
jgi:hypothetical protein